MRYGLYDIVTGKTLKTTFIQKHLAEKVAHDLNEKEPIPNRWLVVEVN